MFYINMHTNTTTLHSNYPDWKCYGCSKNICEVVKASVAQDGKGVNKQLVVSLPLMLVAVSMIDTSRNVMSHTFI